MDICFINIIFLDVDWLNSLLDHINIISAFVTILGFGGIWGIFKYFKSYFSWRSNQMSKLGEIADKEKIKLIKSKKYIPTMGQKEAPHDAENAFISPNRSPLLDDMMKVLKANDSESKQRYIILGGSGMGKSTFLAALFYRYINKCNLIKFHSPIYVKSLCNPKVIELIREIKDEKVNNSILLLDALDENIHASSDIIKFMNELEAETHEFSTVIITCRTQFYKDAESEPDVWSIPNSGASRDRVIKYNKIYISPFTDQEVDTFLSERYGSSANYAKARIIANRSTDVMLRPMILSFMDDLLDLNDLNDNITTVEIYYKIIDKWFERECEIKNIEKSKLLSFSKKLAIYMYDQWFTSNNLFLSGFQFQKFARDNGIDADPYSYKERSLINRTSNGDVKFSHRSFWEFFLAIDTFERPGKRYTAKGLDMAQKFHEEIFELYNDKKYLEYIDYFDYSFSFDRDFSDSEIKKMIEKIQGVFRVSLNPDTSAKDNPEQVIHMIYELREMLLKRLRNQFSLIYDYFIQNPIPKGKKYNIRDLYYVERINTLLEVMQDFFEVSNLGYFKEHSLPTILRVYSEIVEFNDSFSYISKATERLLYPIFVKETLQGMDKFEAIHMGLGFSQNEDVKYSIKTLFKRDPIPFIFLYLEVQTMTELMEFIKMINIYNDKNRCIIIRVSYNNTLLEYVVDNNIRFMNDKGKTIWKHDDIYNRKISRIIHNLIKAKNYIS